MNRIVDEEYLIFHILTNLPKVAARTMSPYKIERSNIEDKISSNNTYSVDDLTNQDL